MLECCRRALKNKTSLKEVGTGEERGVSQPMQDEKLCNTKEVFAM